MFVKPPDGAISVLVTAVVCIPVVYLIRKYAKDKRFLVNIFFIALLARLAFGFVIQVANVDALIAEDTTTYDGFGWRLAEVWLGYPVPNDSVTWRATQTYGPGWGMIHLVGAIYFICGRSFLAAQAFCGAVGAATAPLIYFCAQKIYHNRRVAKLSAVIIAIFPSFILWSGQLLKDGLVIFLLVASMTMVLQLQKKFSVPALLVLLASLFGILSLRFYIFYMVVFAVVGSFVISLSPSITSIVRRSIVILLMGLALTYLGVLRNAEKEFEIYANLEVVQRSRLDLATSAESGFAEDLDVSTTEGAITAIPIGMTYLMLAPFPWQVSSFRQALTLPETFVWWAMMPLLFSGLWYTIKYRLRDSVPILVFSLMLTIAYSIFQGNIGTAYRQRTQIQVFLFIFISVGWSMIQERNENKIIKRQIKEAKLQRKLRARQVGMDG